MSRQLFFCTHHKTGTNFVLATLRGMLECTGRVPWYGFYDPKPIQWDTYIHQHARIEQLDDPGADMRGVHFVRHPKSLVVSSMLYHMRCEEPWAHIPMEAFTAEAFWAISNRATYERICNDSLAMDIRRKVIEGRESSPAFAIPRNPALHCEMAGQTYAEWLKRLPNDEERMLFEMRAFAGHVLCDMLEFADEERDPRFMRVGIEDVSHDPTMQTLERMFGHLGFAAQEHAACMDAARANCMWHIGRESISHATIGLSDRWRAYFTPRVEAEFSLLFGDAVARLGYD